MFFRKRVSKKTKDQHRDLCWSEVDFEIKYLAFPAAKYLRFPMTALMTDIDKEGRQHWSNFGFDQFLEVIETRARTKNIPKADWTWYTGKGKTKFEVADGYEFHVLLKRFKKKFEEEGGRDTIALTMIRAPQQSAKSAKVIGKMPENGVKEQGASLGQ